MRPTILLAAGMLVLAALAAPVAAAPGAPAPFSAARKLLQRYYGNGVGYNNQLAAQRTAAVVTKQAIRNAVNNPYPGQQYDATRFATGVGQTTSTLATVAPCTLTWGPGCYWGWNGRKLRAAVFGA